jgi:hypothetical protein
MAIVGIPEAPVEYEEIGTMSQDFEVVHQLLPFVHEF